MSTQMLCASTFTTPPTHNLLGLGNAPAKGREQRREAVLFFGLSGIVGGPVLLVGDLDGLGFGYGGRAVRVRLPLKGVFDGVDVLALISSYLVIGASAAGESPFRVTL